MSVLALPALAPHADAVRPNTYASAFVRARAHARRARADSRSSVEARRYGAQLRPPAPEARSLRLRADSRVRVQPHLAITPLARAGTVLEGEEAAKPPGWERSWV